MTFAEIENGLSAFNVKKNMTPQQIKIFVQDFIDDYSHDSIADLKVCLKNAPGPLMAPGLVLEPRRRADGDYLAGPITQFLARPRDAVD